MCECRLTCESWRVASKPLVAAERSEAGSEDGATADSRHESRKHLGLAPATCQASWSRFQYYVGLVAFEIPNGSAILNGRGICSWIVNRTLGRR
jgi:hypothetical protein